ncbi:beta-lactamase class A [Kibdelosporangium banguiense]|uniref:Beta-lactamase n=1 Tax=Kibdelosporangium banguiense TaxID=1365924 RepID=A0ABS4T995_9PSEU|nr:class A beta-lactamase [Kibdelosporangium banguiense]MBP2321000.1 beta-lactamase class A [Kibdelosporangium banguiense]
MINRLLAALVAVPLAACSATPAAPLAPAPTTTTAPEPWVAQLKDLETKFDARLGVYAVNVSTGKSLSQRQDERFAILSVFKGYACGALLKAHPLSTGYFDQRITYSQADLVPNSPVSTEKLATGMTVSEACHAAITKSGNTAGNQLLKLLGGPTKLTEFARSINDPATRLDRWEVDLNVVPSGEERDTTTPLAIGNAYKSLVLGDILGPAERTQLKDWLLANTTGATRIRAGVPPTWPTADKTGTGSYASANDVAITWPTPDTPILIAILTDKTPKAKEDTKPDNALLAETARIAATSLS